MKNLSLILITIFILPSWASVEPAVVQPAKPFVAEYVVKVAPAEYLVAHLYNTGIVRAYINDGPGTAVHYTNYNIGARTAIDITPGFNRVIILDDQHFPWINTPTGTPATNNSCTRYDTDSSGAAFNYIYSVYSFFNAYFGRSQDSTQLFHWALQDSYKWVDVSGTRVVKPYLLWTAPAGRKIVTMAPGKVCMVLLDNGDVYERVEGTGTSFTKVTLPANSYCVAIASSYRDIRFYILHNYVGGDAALGKLSWAGSESGYVGDNNSRTTPFLLSFSLPYNIRQIVANDNSYHFIDSVGDMYGGGDNAMGEVGNGTEIVNRYNYWNYCCNTPYAWSTDKGQAYVVPPVKIGAGHTWKRLYDERGFAFHCFATDSNDSLWRWGRSKSFDLWNYTATNEAGFANCFDILVPTMWTPMANTTGSYITFALPKCHAGNDTTIAGTSVTRGGTDTAASAGPVGYSIVSTQWSQKSGPNSATFTTPTSASTAATGLIPGTYVFYKKITDNNTGIWADSVTITVNAPTGCNGCWIHHRYYRRKTL